MSIILVAEVVPALLRSYRATGGTRAQEGTLALMQMAKVSCMVEAHQKAGLPFISILKDPSFGGASASYAMQADIRIAMSQV